MIRSGFLKPATCYLFNQFHLFTKNPTSISSIGVRFRWLASQEDFDSTFQRIRRFSVIDSPSFVRTYCSGKKRVDSNEWTEDIEYLDEFGSLIY